MGRKFRPGQVAQDAELSPPPWLLHPVEARRNLAVTLPTQVTRLGCAGLGRRRSRRFDQGLAQRRENPRQAVTTACTLCRSIIMLASCPNEAKYSSHACAGGRVSRGW